MNVRLIFGYVALCSGLSAYDLRGITGLWFYGLGLVVCLLSEPAYQWVAARRAYAIDLKQFQNEMHQARLLASQKTNVGGNL